eukprot:s3916_g4.t1
MYKPPGYAKCGSSMVDAKKFEDHGTGDYLIAKSEPEIGIENDRVAMVVKDVLTDFRYVCPAGRRDAPSTVLAMKHFVDDLENIGIFYSLCQKGSAQSPGQAVGFIKARTLSGVLLADVQGEMLNDVVTTMS